jgi:hypothetical protein
MSRLVHPGAFREVVTGTTNERLIQARNELFTLAPVFASLGLDLFDNFNAISVQEQIALLLVWLVFTSHVSTQELRTLLPPENPVAHIHDEPAFAESPGVLCAACGLIIPKLDPRYKSPAGHFHFACAAERKVPVFDVMTGQRVRVDEWGPIPP